jgi:sugar lactone lactonase YvrE
MKRLSILAVLAVELFLVGCKSAGEPMPEGAGTAMKESFAALERRDTGVEVVARLDAPPGNVAVCPEGRIFLSQHPFGAPTFSVMELLPGGTTRPYPSETWARAPGADGVGLQAVIGLECDKNGVLWLLDNGKGAGEGAKLVAWDTRGERLVRSYPVSAAAVPNSFIQDLVVEPERGVAVLADMGRGDLIGQNMPGLIIVDLKTEEARRVLQGHPSLEPEDVPMVVEGRTLAVANPQGQFVETRLGLNPITLDPAGEWVYYGSMNGRVVWRVKLADLADPALSAEERGRRVQKYGQKALSDGISMDSAGNIYVTDLGAGAIGVTSADGSYRELLKDPLLSWPDGLSYGPDGYFYVTVNQLNRHPIVNQGKAAMQPPFLLVRFRPLAPGAVGR